MNAPEVVPIPRSKEQPLPPAYLKTRPMGKHIGVSPSTLLDAWRKYEDFPAPTKLNSLLLWPVPAVVDWFANHAESVQIIRDSDAAAPVVEKTTHTSEALRQLLRDQANQRWAKIRAARAAGLIPAKSRGMPPTNGLPDPKPAPKPAVVAKPTSAPATAKPEMPDVPRPGTKPLPAAPATRAPTARQVIDQRNAQRAGEQPAVNLELIAQIAAKAATDAMLAAMKGTTAPAGSGG